MRDLLFFLLPLSFYAWYLLGLYDGFIKGYVRCYLNKNTLNFTKGWRQGFRVAEKLFRRKRDDKGRFV